MRERWLLRAEDEDTALHADGARRRLRGGDGGTYDNTTALDVNYGERTQDEMCTALLFYTPYTAIDGCLKTP